jgi:beta-mannosidase
MKHVLLSKIQIPFIYLLLVTIIFGCAETTKQDFTEKKLTTNWQFKNLNESNWLLATVPGTVHTDLLNAGIIEDPFYRDNEEKLQWIENETWVYRTSFDLDEQFLDKQNLQLVFDGLDTYAEVKLNGQHLLNTDNMFREWTTDIKPFAKAKNNLLEIIFTPAVLEDSIKDSKVNYRLPDVRGYSRKAPYQYGWDWGPRFVTCGIWRPVKIEGWDGLKIENIQIVQKVVNDKKAEIDFVVNIETNPDRVLNPVRVEVEIKFQDSSIIIQQSNFNPNQGKIHIPISVDNPKLWWCKGLGDPNLYKFKIRLFSENQLLDEQTGHFGIREIELVRQKDSTGESFYFKLNGQPVFLKGANYIPMDNFTPRVAKEDYLKLIKSAVDANMNMLRVWGGGIYEEDVFYDLCDEKGILVWQDFMFACNMYPGDAAFLENVKQEAEDNIIRLRNHPSIALWCGNNEVDEGWHNWGWQESLGYSDEDSTEVWNNYKAVFHQILPEAIQKLDPSRAYHPSSPTIGWGHEESRQIGDSHYWGVWWGEEPFEIYKQRVGRFMSEYGFQGMPEISTIETFTLPEDRAIGSAIMQAHQKHPRGTELIRTYMERDYKIPDDFEDYVYTSQLLQAEGIRTALEAHRRAMPHCMGTLYWQLNDCWPVTSWASLDYYGNWKALHYFAKDAFAETLISPVIEDDELKVYVIFDKTEGAPATLALKLIDFEGNILWNLNDEITIKGLASEVAFSISLSKLLKNHNPSNVVFVAEILSGNEQICRNLLYFEKVKDLQLPKVEPELSIEKVGEGYKLTITSENLIKNLYLEMPGLKGRFDKNFFDVLPGESVVVFYQTKEQVEGFEGLLKLKWVE